MVFRSIDGREGGGTQRCHRFVGAFEIFALQDAVFFGIISFIGMYFSKHLMLARCWAHAGPRGPNMEVTLNVWCAESIGEESIGACTAPIL